MLDLGTGLREEQAGSTVPPSHKVRRGAIGPLDLDDLAVAVIIALVTASDCQLIPCLGFHVLPPFGS